MKDLYCVAFTRDPQISSLRSLRGQHLPLLRSLREQCLATIEQRFGLRPDQVRAYVHYPPQFYSFHVHFTALSVALGCNTERAHLLDDVIDALAKDGEHYVTANLTVRLGEKEPLLARYRQSES